MDDAHALIPPRHPARLAPRVACLTVSHRQVRASDRAAFALDDRRRAALWAALRERLHADADAELLALSTCNRTELYLAGRDADAVADAARDALARVLAADCSAGEAVDVDVFQRLDGRDAIRHLCRVAAGLESVVIGETQILQQLREAFAEATTAGSIGQVLHVMAHHAFTVARRVHSDTRIGDGKVSAPSVAVELATRTLGSLSGRHALVLGAGRMARIAADHLVASGIGSIAVANRTPARAHQLAAGIRGAGVASHGLAIGSVASAARDADVIVAAIPQPAGAPPVLDSDACVPGTVVLDLGVPSPVADALKCSPRVTYVGVDDLDSASASGRQRRLDRVPAAEAIIDAQLDDLFDTSAAIRDGVVQMLFRRFNDATRCEAARQIACNGLPVDEGELATFGQRLVRRLLAPVVQARDTLPDDILRELATLFRYDPPA